MTYIRTTDETKMVLFNQASYVNEELLDACVAREKLWGEMADEDRRRIFQHRREGRPERSLTGRFL